jgi:ubiquitin-activating enzyme E1
MAAAQVLVLGLKGLGAEVAKNVILAGVKAVTLHDTEAVQLADLGAQFYLMEADVGANRAAACQAKLQELNTAVAVTASAEELSDAFLRTFDVVVATGLGLAESVKLDETCREHGVAFIRAEIRGVFGSVFCDFGNSFAVLDTDGEEPVTGILAGVTQSESTTIISCVEDERLEFQDGQLVTFTEVEGIPQLNDGKPRRVKNVKAHSFELEEPIKGEVAYTRGGLVVQVKEPKQLSFRPLADALAEPGEFLLSDFAKLDRSAQLHVGFQALDAFRASNGRLPAPASADDAAAVASEARRLAEASSGTKADLDEEVLKLLAFGAAGELNPMAAMFGGIIGQEVMKAVSGKFHPLFQWFYFDSVESLPPVESLTPEACAPKGTRYDGQVGVFGAALQAKLEALNLFLVGAGALGCEFVKNFACMGVASGGDGRVTVTDDDVIEKSNLSRQFLFRDWDIGNAKSTAAAKAAEAINPALRVRALQNRVSPDSETVFDDAFWGALDVVVNALDNVNARLYVDSRCVYFGRPLLESGTLGAKANTQVVVPNITENYGASRDPPEKQAPMCTLHSFPHNIDHCLTFARSEFEGLLEKSPAEANAFLLDPSKYLEEAASAGDSAARERLERVAEVLVSDRCHSFEECIAWARRLFETQFHDRIAQLVYTFPEDAVTSTGAPFWSAPKRFPRALTFDAADPSQATFIQAASILKARTYCIQPPQWAFDPGQVARKAAEVDIPPFQPQQGVRIETDPKAASAAPGPAAGDDESTITSLAQQLREAQAKLEPGYKLEAIQFEKDDDTNYHMDFILGLANMRARNYTLQEVDKLKAKLIAGKIIPAIATATSLATGLVCLELYKVIQGKSIEAYRNTFANLALPLFSMAEPIPPKGAEYDGMKWTLWDRWILEGDMTVQDVLDWFAERKLEAYSFSYGQSLLYNNIFPKHRERLGKKLSDLVQSVGKADLSGPRAHFDVVVACEDEAGEDIDVPLVSIKFK